VKPFTLTAVSIKIIVIVVVAITGAIMIRQSIEVGGEWNAVAVGQLNTGIWQVVATRH
jgi:cytochrome b subunit of formate dehydrogenase